MEQMVFVELIKKKKFGTSDKRFWMNGTKGFKMQ